MFKELEYLDNMGLYETLEITKPRIIAQGVWSDKYLSYLSGKAAEKNGIITSGYFFTFLDIISAIAYRSEKGIYRSEKRKEFLVR